MASFLSGSPARANPIPGNAPPAEQCAVQSGDTIFSQNYSCIIGGNVYSSFVNKSDSEVLRFATYTFTDSAPFFTISVSPQQGDSFVPGSDYEFAYSMTVFDAIGTGNRIASISTGATPDRNSTNPSFLQILDAFPTLVAPGEGPLGDPIIASVIRVNGGPAIETPGFFGTPVISADFVSFLSVDDEPDNSVSSFNNTVIRLDAPPQPPGESVPGPLPILGAGAAFGMSRKLRRRIRQTA
ncbi:hypothetical protein [Synechococcus sp. CCY 9618]|uniref:hypothetical protein n=1 Tax=Synechococcus sp. CCY 9618 TaxID=2815602 RepID=UPI001C22F123|nr:hypothetical protein [Synechococcus sp. CCY 9618]